MRPGGLILPQGLCRSASARFAIRPVVHGVALPRRTRALKGAAMWRVVRKLFYGGMPGENVSVFGRFPVRGCR